MNLDPHFVPLNICKNDNQNLKEQTVRFSFTKRFNKYIYQTYFSVPNRHNKGAMKFIKTFEILQL